MLKALKPEEERKVAAAAGGGGGRRVFDPAARYYWVYAGSTFWKTVSLVLLVVAILALCMYPLWPTAMRVLVWYIAVTVLLAILGLTLVQLLVFACAWLVGWEVWLLPNLWADVPVWELFKPAYTVARAKKGAALMRLGFIGLLAALAYWVTTAPAGEMNEFIDQQKQFVNDLYAGTLLGDGSAAASAPGARGAKKDRYAGMGYGKRGGVNVPDLEEFDKVTEDRDGGGGGARAA